MQKAWWKKLILTIVIIIMLAVFFGAAVFAIVGGAAMTSSSSAELASFAGNSLVVTGIATIVLVALAIWALIIECKFLGALSRAFGHGTGFAAGLFFFPYIFYMILGFNGDQFNAPQA